MNEPRTTRIGLALGSGASRGWSHIGVLNALRREGIEPDIICGTSIGAMIGAAYIAGNLDKLENWVLSATQLDVFKFFEIHLTQVGFVDTDRFQQFLHDYVVEKDTLIENLSMPYAAVATDVKSGREIWLTEGNTLEATRASMALPGLFPSVQLDNKWLVDGGLVNPVPVSTCRALGADFVIAVNLNTNILGRRVIDRPQEEPPESSGLFGIRFSCGRRRNSRHVRRCRQLNQHISRQDHTKPFGRGPGRCRHQPKTGTHRHAGFSECGRSDPGRRPPNDESH